MHWTVPWYPEHSWSWFMWYRAWRQTNENAIFRSWTEPFISLDDGKNHNKSAFGLSTSCMATNSNYSQNTYRSQTAVGIQRSKLAGVESMADKAINCAHIKTKQQVTANASHNARHYSYKKLHVHNEHYNQLSKKNTRKMQIEGEYVQEPAGYNKPTYAVLIGKTVMVYNAQKFASLPNCSKYMVKERQQDSSGITKVKLALKYCEVKRYKLNAALLTYQHMHWCTRSTLPYNYGAI